MCTQAQCRTFLGRLLLGTTSTRCRCSRHQSITFTPSLPPELALTSDLSNRMGEVVRLGAIRGIGSGRSFRMPDWLKALVRASPSCGACANQDIIIETRAAHGIASTRVITGTWTCASCETSGDYRWCSFTEWFGPPTGTMGRVQPAPEQRSLKPAGRPWAAGRTTNRQGRSDANLPHRGHRMFDAP